MSTITYNKYTLYIYWLNMVIQGQLLCPLYSPLLEAVPGGLDFHLHQHQEAELLVVGMSAVDETMKSHCTGCYQSSLSHLTPDRHGLSAGPKNHFNFYISYNSK